MDEDLKTHRIKGMGWRPDLPDMRDFRASLAVSPVGIPASYDLRDDPAMPEINDQGDLGSCTSFSVGDAVNFEFRRMGIELKTAGKPSHLFLYYRERVIEHGTRYDSGAQIRDGVKVSTKGLCDESDWPYDISLFAKRPPKQAYKDSHHHRVRQYARVAQDSESIQAAIASNHPVMFGFTVYESFESPDVARTGIVPFPSVTEGVLGGHAVSAVGYKTIDGTLYFICRNSWGTAWGDKGFFYMPWTYIVNGSLASDFWVVTAVE